MTESRNWLVFYPNNKKSNPIYSNEYDDLFNHTFFHLKIYHRVLQIPVPNL